MRNCILSLAAGWVIVVFCIYCCCTHSYTKFPNPRFTTFSIIQTKLPTQSSYKIIILRTRNQHNLYQIINFYQKYSIFSINFQRKMFWATYYCAGITKSWFGTTLEIHLRFPKPKNTICSGFRSISMYIPMCNTIAVPLLTRFSPNLLHAFLIGETIL